MNEEERQALVDAMGAWVGNYLSHAKVKNTSGMAFAVAKITAGVGLLAQDFVETMEQAKAN